MRSLPLIYVLLATGALCGADAPPPKGQPTPPTTDLLGNPEVPQLTKEQAVALVALGKQAMSDSNENPRRSVDAAVAFSKALKYYESTGDTELICELEANIFWCKKRMDIDDVKSFLAQKNGDRSVAEALAKADQVATKEVAQDQAHDYFSRAEQFAAKNPGKYDQIAVRFSEVAERFIGTEIGLKAQQASMEALKNHMKAIRTAQEAQRETVFSKSAASAGVGRRMALPSPESQKAAQATIRSLYKADFAKRKPNQRKNLLKKLVDQARTSKDDPAMLHGLLTSAIDLGMDIQDYYAVFNACDLLAGAFIDVDATAQKKSAYAKSKNPTVLAIITLLNQPDDEEANSVVGKYFCYEAQEWHEGLKLLVKGKDAELKAVAEMERIRPEGVAQQIELADKWYDLGMKGRKNQASQEGPLVRAQLWYQRAVSKCIGISKDRVTKRLEEIEDLLPMTIQNYDQVTEKQWDRLKGNIAVVSAAKDRNDIGLRLTPGKKYRIVPHPTETWQPTSFFGNGNAKSVTWKGCALSEIVKGREVVMAGRGDFLEGAMIMQIENGKLLKPGLIEGEGRVYMGPYSDYAWGAGGKGDIRVKIIVAGDDE